MSQPQASPFVPGYHHLGYSLKRMGDLEGAVSNYRKALELNANDPRILANLGAALLEQGRLPEALEVYAKAVALTPDSPAAQSNFGVILAKLGRAAESLAAFRKAVNLEPRFALAHRNLGDALRGNDQLDAAIESYRQALAIKPDYAQVLSNLAGTLCESGRVSESLPVFAEALRHRPSDAETHWNYSLALLTAGDFDRAWPEYEWRWKCPGFRSAPRNFPRPQWDGSDLAGRTILLHAEQGAGDAIQFIRYALLVAERGKRVGATVIVEAPEPLARLFKGLAGIDEVIVTGRSRAEFDLHCPLLSLPGAFGTTLADIPAKVPYLRAPEDETRKWAGKLAGKLAGDRQGLRVGLVWVGSASHTNDRRRSIPAEFLAPLGQVERVVFYSLQKEAGGAEPGLNLIDHTAELNDFADTAALLANLDLLISVDTAAAHLVGAMGKKVWTLLPYAADWRWLEGEPIRRGIQRCASIANRRGEIGSR